MEEGLNKLRNAMKNTTFSQLDFSEQHINDIHQKIQKHEEKEDDILLSVMQLLIHEKTGYEMVQHIRGRGIQKFEENEGFLYTFLHRLEQKGYLLSSWDKAERKLYRLNNKGIKLLKKAERNSSKKGIALGIMLEVRL